MPPRTLPGLRPPREPRDQPRARRRRQPRRCPARARRRRSRTGAARWCRGRAGSCPSMSSVGRSTAPVSGSRLVTRQRPTWPWMPTSAEPIRTRRPTQPSSAWRLDAVDLDQHPEAAGVDRVVTVGLGQPAQRAARDQRHRSARPAIDRDLRRRRRSGWPKNDDSASLQGPTSSRALISYEKNRALTVSP